EWRVQLTVVGAAATGSLRARHFRFDIASHSLTLGGEIPDWISEHPVGSIDTQRPGRPRLNR
ncbi:hypothetical protein, partial [Mycobacteroides abscessus]|uniref:hypothetical protein n=1 Tax=Mycobacteroides abscessus TaxID=36809 RepID=UPI0019D30A2E